jgi:hypothetical protein
MGKDDDAQKDFDKSLKLAPETRALLDEQIKKAKEQRATN